jgi:hypothetical protein
MRYVNWQVVNAVYCAVIWVIVLALLFVILAHGFPQSPQPAHHALPAPIR